MNIIKKKKMINYFLPLYNLNQNIKKMKKLKNQNLQYTLKMKNFDKKC